MNLSSAFPQDTEISNTPSYGAHLKIPIGHSKKFCCWAFCCCLMGGTMTLIKLLSFHAQIYTSSTDAQTCQPEDFQ